MNYIVEQNTFRKYAHDNYLSGNAMLLWYALFGINNDLQWVEWFKVDNARLKDYSAIRREASLIEARNELIKHGLIQFKKGSKGHPSEYHIVSFESVDNVVDNNAGVEIQNNEYAQQVNDNECNDNCNNNEPEDDPVNEISEPADETAKGIMYPRFIYFYNVKNHVSKNENVNNNKMVSNRNYNGSGGRAGRKEYYSGRYKNRNRFNAFEQREYDMNDMESCLLDNLK